MKTSILTLSMLCFFSLCQAQNTSTQVNPNGTHTTTFHNGNTSTQVNPNGTQTTTFYNENKSGTNNYKDRVAKRLKDGSLLIQYEDGSLVKVKPDGERIIIRR